MDVRSGRHVGSASTTTRPRLAGRGAPGELEPVAGWAVVVIMVRLAGISSVADGHDDLLGRAGGERELEGVVDVGEGDAVADQPGEAVLVLGELGGDLEDLGGVALGGDDGH